MSEEMEKALTIAYYVLGASSMLLSLWVSIRAHKKLNRKSSIIDDLMDI